MIIKPRGTTDLLPEQTPLWQAVEQRCREISALYGYGEIRFPTFESTELFQRGVGDTTDVVQKEMYTFSDKDGRSMTLRPEGTACVVRSIIENGRCGDAMPLKLYYFTSCFRYEKPAAGRYREFYQYGTECFGSVSPSSDASAIALAYNLLTSLGIKGLTLKLNSIGCKNCRPNYRTALVDYFSDKEESLCETCRGRLKTNPMRILDCKNPECAQLAKGAPKTTDYLCEDCKTHFNAVKSLLDRLGIPYELDTGIVRGLDYYTKTVFEFTGPTEPDKKTGEEKRITLCAGGRYDGLVEEIGGPRLPGIGFAAGLQRLITAMKLSGAELPGVQIPKLYIASLGEGAAEEALRIVQSLRVAGIYAECDLVGRSLKAQMKYADKLGAEFTAIIGDEEISSGEAILKNMKTSEQRKVQINDLADKLAGN